MSDPHHSYDHCSHICHAPPIASNVYQSLDELEFERGIWFAAQHGDGDRIKSLLKHTDVDKRDAAGYTALHYAARNGHLDICKILVQNGTDVNATTRAGNATALHRACSAGKTDIVKYLLEKHADCALKDSDGKTALHRAAESQNVEMCKLLLDSQSSLNKELDCKGKMPADYAVQDELVVLLNTS